MVGKAPPPTKRSARQGAGAVLPILVTLGLLLVAATLAYFLMERARNRPRNVPVLTQEAAAYLPHLTLSDVDMKAAENYLSMTVTTISGQIANTGPRALRLVQISCVFRDPYGRVILRHRMDIVGRKTGPIPSGQARPFEMVFDNIPGTWNQTLPDLVISQIIFQE